VSAPIIGVHHVAIQVDDVDAARVFYSEVLGLTEIERPDFPVGGAWFRLGRQELHLGAADGHVAPERQHFAVHVADLDATVAAIEAHGVSVRKTGLTFPGAGYQAFLRDPSGNLIELNQPE
jgi:catechol 2,3-dioxygenase-like lactoylglutathione lyase family enzyme